MQTPEEIAKDSAARLAEALHQVKQVRRLLDEWEAAVRDGSPASLSDAEYALRTAQSNVDAARDRETWMTGVLMGKAGHNNVRIGPFRAAVAAALPAGE